MPRFSSLLILLFLVLAQPTLAEEDAMAACESYRDVPVHVITRFDEPRYDYNHNISSLTAMSADAHHTIREALSLGLTSYEPTIEMRVPIKGVQLPNGLGCAHVDRVDVTVGFKNVIVYIANEIPQGSCGFKEVMGHEQKHINANLQTLQDYTPRIEAELVDYLRNNSVFREVNIDYAAGLVHEKMQDIIHSTMKEMNEENQQRQLNIDTVAEYKRVSMSCGGQLQSIITPAMRARH